MLITAYLAKKNEKKSTYLVKVGLHQEWLFLFCTCPYFQKKILPCALKHGTRLNIAKIDGMFVKEAKIPIDKHCLLLINYLQLI